MLTNAKNKWISKLMAYFYLKLVNVELRLFTLGTIWVNKVIVTREYAFTMDSVP